MTDQAVSETFETVRRTIHQVLKREPALTQQTLASQVGGWDSHATVAIIFALEARFGCQLTSAEMERVAGVQDLIAIFGRRIPSSGYAG